MEAGTGDTAVGPAFATTGRCEGQRHVRSRTAPGRVADDVDVAPGAALHMIEPLAAIASAMTPDRA